MPTVLGLSKPVQFYVVGLNDGAVVGVVLDMALQHLTAWHPPTAPFVYPIVPGLSRTAANSFEFAGYTVSARAKVIIGNAVSNSDTHPLCTWGHRSSFAYFTGAVTPGPGLDQYQAGDSARTGYTARSASRRNEPAAVMFGAHVGCRLAW